MRAGPVGWGPARLTRLFRGPVRAEAVRLLAASAFLYCMSGLLFALVLPRPQQPNGRAVLAAVLLAFGFAMAEVLVVHLEWAGQAYSLSLSEFPLLLGLFFCPPLLLVAARIVGGTCALVLHRRQPLQKLAFNVGVFTLEASLAVAVFRALHGQDSHLVLTAGVTATLAVVAATASSVTAVTMAVWLSVHRLDRGIVAGFLRTGVLTLVANCSAGVIVTASLWEDPRTLWPLSVVVVTLAVGQRAYARLRHRHANLELLYEFTRNLDRSATGELGVRELLSRARDMMRAQHAEIALLPTGSGEPGNRRWLSADGVLRQRAYQPSAADWPIARVVSDGRHLVVRRGTRDPGLLRFLAENQLRDCLIAPLHAKDQVIGTLLVANRLSDVASFTDEDGNLFQTLATQASAALENGRLLERLSYDARHDALTGLVNRSGFQQRLTDALRFGHRAGPAVLLMDLDRFKEVNDTLGHHHGDLLIREVAGRMSDSAPPGATVARLGGDEFALLLPGVDVDTAVALARQLREQVSRPCSLDGMAVDVTASLGVAVAPEHGTEQSVLLKHADMAMYAAKSSGSGVELYDRERDEYSPRRLSLASRLRTAIRAGELTLHYQPQVDLAAGRPCAVEALVRWRHPEYGLVAPTEFIPLAEQSDAIGELTAWVLREAVAQLATWRTAGLRLGMSVNLSMRNLRDVATTDLISELLATHRVPAGDLTLEITESHLMADAGRTLPLLQRLTDLGLRLAVDDFGTGYSSLAYLHQLPVHELKIDKSFLQGRAAGDTDLAIVRAVVTLGHSLGLLVVAEGVEDPDTERHVAELGCDRIQGYVVSPGLPAAELTDWLARCPRRPGQPAPR